MKPKNAIEIVVPSDLTGVSLLHAQDDIQKELSPDYKNDLYWELRVASQGMGEAIKLAYLLGVNVNVDFEYGADEWSLTGRNYHTKELSERTIWSPSA